MQCGGSGMFIPDPGSKNSNKRQGWKKFCCQTIFFGHKFHKTEYYFIFDMLTKNIWPNFPRIIEVFTQKIVTKPSKIWVWDPRSGIREKPIPDPGSRGQKGTGSRIRIRNTAVVGNFCPLADWFRIHSGSGSETLEGNKLNDSKKRGFPSLIMFHDLYHMLML